MDLFATVLADLAGKGKSFGGSRCYRIENELGWYKLGNSERTRSDDHSNISAKEIQIL